MSRSGEGAGKSKEVAGLLRREMVVVEVEGCETVIFGRTMDKTSCWMSCGVSREGGRKMSSRLLS